MNERLAVVDSAVDLAYANGVAVAHHPQWDHQKRAFVCAADKRPFPCSCYVNAVALIACECPDALGHLPSFLPAGVPGPSLEGRAPT